MFFSFLVACFWLLAGFTGWFCFCGFVICSLVVCSSFCRSVVFCLVILSCGALFFFDGLLLA